MNGGYDTEADTDWYDADTIEVDDEPVIEPPEPDDAIEELDAHGRTADWNWPRGYGGGESIPW